MRFHIAPTPPAGLQTTGAWLILSQGFAVAVSACLAARACDARLTSVVRRLLHERPGLLSRPWLLGAAATGAADPGVVCKAFTLGMQVRAGSLRDPEVLARPCGWLPSGCFV